MIPDISKHLMEPDNSMYLQSSSDEAHKQKACFKNMFSGNEAVQQLTSQSVSFH